MENVSNNESNTIQLTKELIKISSKKRLKTIFFRKVNTRQQICLKIRK